jgi:hypothetical protein
MLLTFSCVDIFIIGKYHIVLHRDESLGLKPLLHTDGGESAKNHINWHPR